MKQDWKDLLASLASNEPTVEEASQPATEPIDSGKEKETQKLHVVIDKKGRKGKVATIIEGFTLADEEVDQIASELKRKIGTGGSARGGEILLQGDWKDRVTALLREKGWSVK